MGFPLGSLFGGFAQGYKDAKMVFDDVYSDQRDKKAQEFIEKWWNATYGTKPAAGETSTKPTRDALLAPEPATPAPVTPVTREALPPPPKAEAPAAPAPKPIVAPAAEWMPVDYNTSAAAAGRAVTPLPVGQKPASAGVYGYNPLSAIAGAVASYLPSMPAVAAVPTAPRGRSESVGTFPIPPAVPTAPVPSPYDTMETPDQFVAPPQQAIPTVSGARSVAPGAVSGTPTSPVVSIVPGRPMRFDANGQLVPY